MTMEYDFIDSPIGTLTVITGCMYSGKSTELIRRLEYHSDKDLNVIAFKPLLDNRYSASKIVSHTKLAFPAVPVREVFEIYDLAKSADVVGIDEVQFFSPDLTEVITELNHEGKHLIVSGLDLDFNGRPFGVTPTLMAMSEVLIKTYGSCEVCGFTATRTQRMVNSNNLVLIGSTGVYEARCRAHFIAPPTQDHDDF